MGTAWEAGMERIDRSDVNAFESRDFVPLSGALDVVRHMHTSAKPMTVRKFLVGIAIHGSDSGMLAYAERFDESYVRLDREHASVYHSSPRHFESIPNDFWRIGMACGEEANSSFAANSIDHNTELTVSELSPRIRDMAYGELQSERVRLTQIAVGIHFPLERLLALAKDPEWQAWGSVAQAISNRGKNGRPKEWKWDEVKSALTIEAARNPEILAGGAGKIIQFINDEMRHLHYEQLPDRKEVDAYVRHFSYLWAPPASDAPSG
ncbi:hypothetical protein N9D37_01980 [Erythrobacter sp.]|nr:hypothetical protein [Erythrobacter sp.]